MKRFIKIGRNVLFFILLGVILIGIARLLVTVFEKDEQEINTILKFEKDTTKAHVKLYGEEHHKYPNDVEVVEYRYVWFETKDGRKLKLDTWEGIIIE